MTYTYPTYDNSLNFANQNKIEELVNKFPIPCYLPNPQEKRVGKNHEIKIKKILVFSNEWFKNFRDTHNKEQVVREALMKKCSSGSEPIWERTEIMLKNSKTDSQFLNNQDIEICEKIVELTKLVKIN